MIEAILFNPQDNTFKTGGEELIGEWRNSEHLFLWLDLQNNDEDTERRILSGFEIHELAIQDALRARHPPKFERFHNCAFLLLRGLDSGSPGIDFDVIQLALFIGDRYLISRRKKPSTSIAWLRQSIEEDPSLLRDSPIELAIHVARRLARRYIEILLELEPRLEELEAEIFSKPHDDQLAELTRYKAKLREAGRIARYHATVCRAIRENAGELSTKDLGHQITDLFEQVERTVSLSDLHYDMAKDLTDGYLALSSHRLNRVMQILTVITVIFVPLTFIAGIYGMNFENMPELSSRHGYFFVLGVMFTIGAALLLWFRRRGWV